MKSDLPEAKPDNYRTIKELLVVGAVGLSFFALSSYFNLFTLYTHFSQKYGQASLDELLIVLSGLVFVVLFFNARRGIELNQETAKLKQMEESLKTAQSNLEVLVDERTTQLQRMNEQLKQEVNERLQVENELGKSEALFRAIFEDSAVGITVSDLEGRPLRVNPAFREMLGYGQDELSGMFFSDLTHPDDVAANVGLYKEMLAGKRDHFFMTKRYIHKDGQTVWGQVTVSLIRDTNSDPQYVIGIVEDITVRKQLEEERAKSAKLESIGLLAGGIAHDFNNILTAILGNLSLAKIFAKRGDDVTERLTLSESAALRAKKLTHQLLTFSKGGAPIKRTVSIGKLIKDSTKFALSGSNVKCECTVPEDISLVEADEGQINQVIQNIIANADQAMPDGGTIRVTLENCMVRDDEVPPLPAGNYVKITIKDQGVGIPKEFLDKIFDPYFTTKKTGSGLGLASSYSIIQNHGGHITVDSILEVGTTVSVYLPTTRKTTSFEASKEDTICKGTGRILLMDDEEMVTDIAGAALKQAGYEVEIAEDGRQAVALYTEARQGQKPFQAVILDLTVPGGMGGKEAVEKLRKIDPQVKAIVSSGYSKDPVLSDFRKYGFAGMITKPYNISELTQTVKIILRQSSETGEQQTAPDGSNELSDSK